MPSKEPVLRARDVARILGLGPHDMIELARKKKLKATKVGRYCKYRRAHVMAYIDRTGNRS